jgi:hypothetical protein
MVVIASRQVCIRPTLETARAAGGEENEHHDDPRSVLRLLGAQMRRERNNLMTLAQGLSQSFSAHDL